MVGKIFITRSGYDPQLGKHVKDPFLGSKPSLGACRPDIRKQLAEGDHIFTISGRVPDANQYIMGGFEIASKIDAQEAFYLYPEQRLRTLDDGQLTGNVIVNSRGQQHELDDHRTFESRISNYIVGRNPLVLVTDEEIARGRKETLEALQDILHKSGNSPFKVVGRFGSSLDEEQVLQMRRWLASIKVRNN
jgi:hypothetical protein